MKVISIIIPCKDDAKLLAECLRCVHNSILDVPSSLGIVINAFVVIEGKAGFIEAVAVASDWGFLALPADKAKGPGEVRHAGAVQAETYKPVHAKEHYLLFTDADSEVPLDWVWRHYKNLQHHDSSWGSVRLPLGSPFTTAFEKARSEGKLDNRLFEQNCAVEATAYEAAGGFQSGRNEGPSLLRRLRARGYTEVRTPMAVITSDRREGRVSGGFAEALMALTKTREWQ